MRPAERVTGGTDAGGDGVSEPTNPRLEPVRFASRQRIPHNAIRRAGGPEAVGQRGDRVRETSCGPLTRSYRSYK